MVVDQALRDEGTSHHYLPPSRFGEADREVSQAIVSACERSGLAVGRGNSWTTDAIFRETRSRIDRRVEEGCSMVEMEASAFFAVGKHRGVRVGQLLYAGDTLAADDWDGRDWTSATQTRQPLFDICLDTAASLTQD
jgi:uridine phosphorylase